MYSLQVEEVENVRVVTRVRPLSTQELEKKCRSVVNVDSQNNAIFVSNPSITQRSIPKCFNFDVVFPPDSKQVLGLKFLESMVKSEKCIDLFHCRWMYTMKLPAQLWTKC